MVEFYQKDRATISIATITPGRVAHPIDVTPNIRRLLVYM
jgi:hypothetical protein